MKTYDELINWICLHVGPDNEQGLHTARRMVAWLHDAPRSKVEEDLRAHRLKLSPIKS